jgi:antitoxin HicB
MCEYPVAVTQASGAVLVTFRDVPEAATEGENRRAALLRASDALETGLSFYIADRQPLPAPSAARPGEVMVPLSILGTAKVALYEAMRERQIGKAALARLLNVHLPQVERLLDLCHASKMEQVETALAVLGKRLVVSVADAA